jgi:hypothetical protein
VRELLSDPEAPVFLALGAVFLAIACLVLALSWRDSVRAIREFCAPLKFLRRPRFGLRALVAFTAAVAIVLKLGMHLNWLPQWPWLERVAVFAAAVFGVCLVLFLIHLFLSTFERRPTIGAQPPIGVDENSPADESRGGAENEKKGKHLRFRVRKRSIFPFRW